MNTVEEELKPIQFVRDLCRGKNENEVLEAEESLRELFLVINEMCDRLEGVQPYEESFDGL